MQSAVSEFERLYKEKTGNDWSDRAHASKQPNKFYPLDIDYGEDDSSLSLADAGSNSKLPLEIQDLVKMIFDVESMKKAMMEFEVRFEATLKILFLLYYIGTVCISFKQCSLPLRLT